MKGVVFTEFFDMLEQAHGYELVDKLLETTELESGGVYTACLLYTSPSPRDATLSRMPSSA